jgi:DNA repair photolyase
MSKTKRSINEPFYLNGKRAMVSLGPLNDKVHCPYSCAFCYVQDEFVSYAKLDVDEIISFLKHKKNDYNIIYVSGDTDSFAPPRTERGLDLLHKITMEIDSDLLFTTRTIFSDENYEKIKKVIEMQKSKNRELYACVSITRFSPSTDYLEPHPIPTPSERIGVLRHLKELDATTVLAMRPFLPVVKLQDYLDIIDLAKEFVDIVLGECFYFVRGEVVQQRMFPHGIPKEVECNITKKQTMVFDDNSAYWDIWASSEYQETVKAKCDKYGIIFSMHSDDGIEKFIQNKKA